MLGLRFNERLAKAHFWLMFISFNSTFLPLFALGLEGMPRRVSTYEPSLQALNVLGLDLRVRARLLDADLPLQRRLLADLRARARRGQPVALEVASSGRCRRPCPVNNFEQIPVFDSDPYDYGTPVPIGGGGRPATAGA